MTLDNRNQSVARAVQVLDRIAASAHGAGVRDLARELGLAPSIVQRHVTTLAEAGYLEQDARTLKYRIGYHAFEIGSAYLDGVDVSEASQPELRALAEQHQLNCYLGVLRDGALVYIAAIQSKGPIAITTRPGKRAPLHSTALGKVLLADLDDAEAAALLGPQPFLRCTPRTKTRLKPLLAELAEVRRLGFAVSDGENLANVLAVGAAIRDASGRVVAGLSGALPIAAPGRAGIETLSRIVMAAAARISRRLGAPQPGRRAAALQ